MIGYKKAEFLSFTEARAVAQVDLGVISQDTYLGAICQGAGACVWYSKIIAYTTFKLSETLLLLLSFRPLRMRVIAVVIAYFRLFISVMFCLFQIVTEVRGLY